MGEETISAITTALGEGAVGIVRISGENALAVGEKLFSAASKRPLAAYATHTLVYGHIKDEDGSIVDEVMAVYMAAPRSYTKEDVVEIQCHGGIQSLKKILELTYKAGARAAEPGEFTKRAFLNGRIDLTQAEAVMDIIKSRSEASLKLAVRQQQGQLAKKIRNLRTALVDVVVNLEAVIDYPEEDIEDVTYSQVTTALENCQLGLKELLSNAHTGRILREGLKTAIVGRPNVGKSSLLNALLEEERAIVSEFAGTTRDVIEEQLLLDGVPLVLADTAGIHDTDDYVEKIGVDRSKKQLDNAELIIAVLDGSMEITSEDEAIFTAIAAKNSIVIVNKTDLEAKLDIEALVKRFGEEKIFQLSAKTTEGLDKLKLWLRNYVYGQEGTLTDSVYLQNARQEELVRQALACLDEAAHAAAMALPYDCIEIDVKHAIELLGSITGDTVQDEIINQIFSRFCIGK